MRYFIKILLIFIVGLVLVSCHKGLNQSSMFNDRGNKNKKGVYNTGMKGNKPPSLQIKKDYDKLSKHDTDPKKARKAQDKEMKKKRRAADKARAKNNKKRHVKVKTTKGKTGGDK